MNRVTTGLVSADCKAQIAADLSSLFTDPDVPRASIEIAQPYAAPTVDYAAGTATRNASTAVALALRGEVTLEEVARSQGGLQVGDVRFQVLASDLNQPASLKDALREGSTRYTTLMTSTDPLGLMVTYTCRRSP